jgi:hypothetical protein
MGGKLRTLRKAARKGFAKGLARGVFKKVALKLRVPKGLPNKGARVIRQVGQGAKKAVLATKNNFRRLFEQLHPRMPKRFQVHHSLPQKFEDIMKRAGINIHDMKYLRGVDPKIHSKITTEWGRWERALGHKPTSDEIIKFAQSIERRYGQHFVK